MAKQRRPRAEVEKFVDLLATEMPRGVEWLIGGSWRREAPDIGDLDVMIVTETGLISNVSLPKSFTPLRHGPQIVNGVLTIDGDPVEAIGVDFWSCKPDQVAAFRMFITGPAALNIAQRAHAQTKGLTLSQYGLFNKVGQLSLVTEENVYEYLELPWLEPRERQRYAERKPTEDAEWESWEVASTTTAAAYQVRRKGDYWDCSCLGYKYSREAPRSCKHIELKKTELTK